MDAFIDFGLKHGRKVLILVAALVHVAFMVLITIRLPSAASAAREAAEVFKMVDVDEFVPPPPPPPPKVREPDPPPERIVAVAVQSATASEIVETERIVVEVDEPPPVAEIRREVVVESAPAEEAIVYVPQHKISRIPAIPARRVLERIEYPELAAKQGVEAVVYLELYIDKNGRIRDAVVLKDPGFGFAQAALKALEGIVCEPAAANGENVAVRFRYPVRFTLKR